MSPLDWRATIHKWWQKKHRFGGPACDASCGIIARSLREELGMEQDSLNAEIARLRAVNAKLLEGVELFGVVLADAEIECGKKHSRAFAVLDKWRQTVIAMAQGTK